jgi:hypothetical protein
MMWSIGSILRKQRYETGALSLNNPKLGFSLGVLCVVCCVYLVLF